MKVLDFGTSAYRDVFLQAKCDEGCLKLAKLLGLDVSQWPEAGFCEGALVNGKMLS